MEMKVLNRDDRTKRALQITIPLNDDTYKRSKPSKNSGKEGKEVQHILSGTGGFQTIADLPGSPRISLNMIVAQSFIADEFPQAAAAAAKADKAAKTK